MGKEEEEEKKVTFPPPPPLLTLYSTSNTFLLAGKLPSALLIPPPPHLHVYVCVSNAPSAGSPVFSLLTHEPPTVFSIQGEREKIRYTVDKCTSKKKKTTILPYKRGRI